MSKAFSAPPLCGRSSGSGASVDPVTEVVDEATAHLINCAVLYVRGIAYNITVPGYGIVFFDAGLGGFYNVEGQ
jgi:hypothetical protein